MLPAKTIAEVVSRLDEIINTSIAQKSRLGYFACLYRKMTLDVDRGIKDGFFADAQRMERLDVIFANRYISAYYSYAKRDKITSSWKTAFEATKQPFTVIQHLLLGMNAHINLDLGIAAAEVSKGTDIQLLKADFNLINNVIGSLVNSVQTDLQEICMPMKLVEYVDNKHKESVINFSMQTARNTAWINAVALSSLPQVEYNSYINGLDMKISQVGRNIINPNFSQSLILRSVRIFEPSDVGEIIKFLKD
ncbi:DUF5995 family protein [Pedobacter sandarakinus]|uniref:DUF5995 family protein n=1 Tax=Pedobacter sandarakinus TaxID=353156 RepID=UPI00224600C8|nr:DUF5995 family protein [Pedobacter sandarakinus]MCX2574221.1 DUF5995 family protein [Pedobacter sandarakinus]